MEINSVSPSKPPRRFLLATTAFDKHIANVAPFIYLFIFFDFGAEVPKPQRTISLRMWRQPWDLNTERKSVG